MLCEWAAVALENISQRHEPISPGGAASWPVQALRAVLARKFPHLPHSRALFDAIWTEAACMPDVSEPADDNDVRLVRAAQEAGAWVFVTGDRRVLTWGTQGDMLILSPRAAWMRLFANSGIN